jgi:NADPH:quinone reductase-like Zn-dependent oxidoreductase
VVDAVDPRPGQTVLIVGASGRVGSFAVQLAAAHGATVLATGGPDDVSRLTGLGAARVVDYTGGPVAEQVLATHPDGVDALTDLVTYAPDGLPLGTVRKGGAVASTLGAATGEALASAGLTGSNIMVGPVPEIIARLAEQAPAGDLTVDVEMVLAFDRAADGLATIAAGQARGKIVVNIAD